MGFVLFITSRFRGRERANFVRQLNEATNVELLLRQSVCQQTFEVNCIIVTG
ncbi:MAG: hypothetical protein ACEY26_00600 [Candidatus Hodgkinia cicadicola]